MSEVSSAPASSEAIARGLRDIRTRRRSYNLAGALGVPAFVVLGFAWPALGPTPRWLAYAIPLVLGIVWLSLTNRYERRVLAATCPRCGGLFHARRWRGFQLRGVFLRSCQHCGLRLYADRDHLRP